MHSPPNTLRLPIPDNCCALARQLVADGLDPNTLLEFMRGDIVSLRGTARAFASRRVRETVKIGPAHVPYDKAEAERLDGLARKKDHTLGGEG